MSNSQQKLGFSDEEMEEFAAMRSAMLRRILLNPEALESAMRRHKDELLDHGDLQEVVKEIFAEGK